MCSGKMTTHTLAPGGTLEGSNMSAANRVFMEDLYAVDPRVIRVRYQRVGVVNVNLGRLANTRKYVQAGSSTFQRRFFFNKALSYFPFKHTPIVLLLPVILCPAVSG